MFLRNMRRRAVGGNSARPVKNAGAANASTERQFLRDSASSFKPDLCESGDADTTSSSQAKERARVKTSLVSVASVAVFAVLAAALCVLATSDPAAKHVAMSPLIKPAYTYGLVTYSTYLGSEMLKMWVGAGTAQSPSTAPSIAVGVLGTITAALHLFGYAPTWATPGCTDVILVLPLRFLTWCVSTCLLAYIAWESAPALPTRRLYTLIALLVVMATSGLLSTVTAGWTGVAFHAFGGCLFYLVGFIQWRIYDAAIADSEGLGKTQTSIRRMRLMSVIVWHFFPIIDLLRRTLLISSVWAEILTATADVLSKGVMTSALAHGALSSAADRKHLRMQQMSADLVEQLREQDKRKDRFFSVITHELRTPLNGMIGLIDTLLASETSMSAKCRKSLTSVSGTGRRFQKLINNILDQAAMQESKLKLMQQPMSVHQLVDEVGQLIEPLMSSQAELVMEMPAQLPLVYGDYNRLIQVMFNLMGNAAKFTSSGRVVVSAKVLSGGNILELSVADTGIGIGKDDLQNVFDAFEQVDQGHSRLYGGTGLGLSLALKLVQAHGGDIKAESVPGIGTRFDITLPVYKANRNGGSGGAHTANAHTNNKQNKNRRTLEKEYTDTLDTLKTSTGDMRRTSEDLQPPKRPPARNSQEVDAAEKAEMNAGRMSSRSLVRGGLQKPGHALRFLGDPRSLPHKVALVEILSVDDDELNQEVIQELMATGGFRVTRAMSANEALKILERRHALGGAQHFPDIILMDLMMPDLTGREATEKIRELYPTSNVPIIMVSAIDDEAEICAGLCAGCNDYVIKPFRHMELMARVGLQLRIVEFYRQSLAAKQNERILMEILPRSVLDRLKAGQTLIADEHRSVSVVFSDIVGFTEMTAKHSTLEIISMLDELFTKFDALVELHCSYKVETIGDAYMIACGLNSQEGHALTAINLAVDMVAAAASMRAPSGNPLNIRVGIHTGPAYAGVVGQKCPRYCLFGDTVNTASRMESNGFPMTVHISDPTFQQASSDPDNMYYYHDLGQRAIKGKGQMRTWLVEEGEWFNAVRDFHGKGVSKQCSSRALLNYYCPSESGSGGPSSPTTSASGLRFEVETEMSPSQESQSRTVRLASMSGSGGGDDNSGADDSIETP